MTDKEKDGGKVTPAMPAGEGESKENDKKDKTKDEKPTPHPKKKRVRKKMKHMKNLEIIMDSLELDSSSKDIISSRWYVNRTRLMKEKKHAWWKTKIVKASAILSSVIGYILMVTSTDLADCAAGCQKECQKQCIIQNSQEMWDVYGHNGYDDKIGDDVTTSPSGNGWFNVQYNGGGASTDPLQNAFDCNCDCYRDECGWSVNNIVAASFMCLAAGLIALDAFLKLDYKIEKMIDVATELNHVGWEFVSLSGDFKQYGTHQDAFVKFAAKVEISIGKIPSSWLPDDEIFEDETYEDEEY